MTSTLMGTFYNYSATFENINPLGDPQLSLLDELGYHELIHLVRIELPDKDDGLDDFLVNDFVDGQGMPDRLYNSRNGSDVEDVYTMNVTDVKLTLSSTAKEYKFVTLTVKTNTSLWFYIRRENTFTSQDFASNEYLLYAEVADDRELLVGKNVWQTSHILDTFYIHLLDFIETNSTGDTSMEIDIQYVLVYGPRNMYAPRFNSTAYTAKLSESRNIGFEVITVYAYDIDNDSIEFGFKNKNVTDFNIITQSYSSAVIIVNNGSINPGLVTLVVIAKDSGIPPRTASVNVTIHITDTDVANTTQIATVTNMTNPSTTSTVTKIPNTPGSVSTIRPTSANETASVSSQNVTSATSITAFSPTTQSFATNGTSSSTVENTTTSVTTDKATTKTVTTTISSTLSSTQSISSMSSDNPQTTAPQSTDNATMTTPRKSSTTQADGIKDEQDGDEVLRWVIPMSLGIAVLVISVAALVCVLRKKP